MPAMTRHDALEIAHRYGINVKADFHTLRAAEVETILEAADFRKYRKPRNANGSRARCFHEYLRRAANRLD